MKRTKEQVGVYLEASRSAQDLSLDQIRDMLYDAVQREIDKDAWLRDVYPNDLIYEKGDQYFRISWSLLDGSIQLGVDAVQVERVWVEARSKQAEESEAGIEMLMRLGVAKDPEGAAWEVTICEAGPTLNGWFIPDDAIRDAAGLFENVDVNLYEFSQGATHIPDPLFDIKALLVKNKVGWIDNVKHVAGMGLNGVLHFLDSAKWLGKNLLTATQEGAKVYGLSYDCPVRAAKAVIDGKSVMKIIKFLSADSVDIVSRPAAGGKFNRAVASVPAQNKEDNMKKGFWDLIKEKRPDLLNGKEFDTVSEQDLTALARMAMEPAQAKVPEKPDEVALLRCEMMLDKKLSALADMPDVLKENIRRSYMGKAFTETDLDKSIGEAKDLQATLAAPPAADGISVGSGVSVGLGAFDRAQMAVDRFFGLSKEDMLDMARMERLDHHPFFEDTRNVQDYDDFDKVPAFHSIREMYAFFTGDPEVSGRFNRKGLPAGLRNVQDINSATFTYVMGNTLGRRLVSLYKEFNFQEDLLISIRKPVKDFRQQEAVLVGGFSDLATVDPEAADFQEIAGVTDEESTYAVAQKGNILTITRKAIVNDDISIVQRLVAGLARAARRTHAKYVWDFFINNGTCSDATAWFTVGHGNLGATALAHATALVAYKALAKMTEKDSGERLGLLDGSDVKPLLVGPVDIMETIQRIADEEFYYTANDLTTKIPNPLRGKVQGKAISLLTDTNDWGMLLPPNIADMVEMGYLNGRQEPEMFVADMPQSEQVFMADKIRYKIRHEYAGAVIDYRSGYKAVVA